MVNKNTRNLLLAGAALIALGSLSRSRNGEPSVVEDIGTNIGTGLGNIPLGIINTGIDAGERIAETIFPPSPPPTPSPPPSRDEILGIPGQNEALDIGVAQLKLFPDRFASVIRDGIVDRRELIEFSKEGLFIPKGSVVTQQRRFLRGDLSPNFESINIDRDDLFGKFNVPFP